MLPPLSLDDRTDRGWRSCDDAARPCAHRGCSRWSPVAGCASTEITQHKPYQVEKLARPDRIIVHNFTGNPADVPPDSPFAARLAGTVMPTPGAARGQPRAGRSDRRASGGGSAGHGAARLAGRRPTRATVDDIVLRGHFVSIDEGSAAKRVLVGFGSGAAEIRAAVEGYQMTAHGLRLLGSGEVRSGGAKLPGMALPLAVLAATANPIGLVVGRWWSCTARGPARTGSKVQPADRRRDLRATAEGRRAAGLDLVDYIGWMLATIEFGSPSGVRLAEPLRTKLPKSIDLVRSRFTPPERRFFEPALLRASSNSLNYRASKHPYQNGRGSVASEKVGRERRKSARNGPSSQSSWFGQFARNDRSCGISTADQEREKECPDWTFWRRDSSLAPNTLSLAQRALSDAWIPGAPCGTDRHLLQHAAPGWCAASNAVFDPDLERDVNINVVRRDPAAGALTHVLVHPWLLPRALD